MLILAAIMVAGVGAWAGLWLERRLEVRGAGGIVLIAATPLVPYVPIGFGASLDDTLPIVGLGLLLLSLRDGARTVRSPRWLASVAAIALFALIVAAALSSIGNGSGIETVRLFLRGAGHMVLVFAIAGAVATAAALSGSARRLAVWALAGTGTLQACIGLAAYLLPLPGGIGLQRMGRGSTLFGEVPGRITGTTGIAANYVGAVLLMSVLVTAGIALTTSGRTRWIASAAAVLQLIALTLTFSRAPLALAVAGLIVLVATRNRPVLLVPVACLMAALALVTPIAERFLSDSTNRLALWWSAFLIMIDHPWTGAGPGMSRVVARADPERYVHTEFGRAPATAHNAILHGGAEMGILGAVGFLLTYFGLLVVAAASGFRAVRARDTLSLSAAVALLGFLVQGMVNNLMTVGMTSVIGFFVAGIVISSHLTVDGSVDSTP
jgi:O-antigen ligase